ncbi:hypothetical protein DFH11DRAFT_1614524 [Phellopilus nigrolimitatus]|nr:hypothetical protein DFH11DRAFT_1614524 [Phellopilus nigrolimitatus]
MLTYTDEFMFRYGYTEDWMESPSFLKLEQFVTMRNRRYKAGSQTDFNLISLGMTNGSYPSIELGHTFFYPQKKICEYFVCSRITLFSCSHSEPNEQHEVIAKEMLKRWNVDDGKSITKPTEGEEAEIVPYKPGEEIQVLMNKFTGFESGLVIGSPEHSKCSGVLHRRLISFFSLIARTLWQIVTIRPFMTRSIQQPQTHRFPDPGPLNLSHAFDQSVGLQRRNHIRRTTRLCFNRSVGLRRRDHIRRTTKHGFDRSVGLRRRDHIRRTTKHGFDRSVGLQRRGHIRRSSHPVRLHNLPLQSVHVNYPLLVQNAPIRSRTASFDDSLNLLGDK